MVTVQEFSGCQLYVQSVLLTCDLCTVIALDHHVVHRQWL